MKLAQSLLVILWIFSGCVGASAAEKWHEHRTRHFIVYYQNAPLTFVNHVEKAAEDEYSELSESMGVHRMQTWTLDNRAEIYVYDDNDHYLESSRMAAWSHGVADPKDKVIRSYPAAHGFFDSTLPHELTHILFREMIGYQAQIPAWLEEGVAMYFEKGQRFGAHDDVRRMIKDGSFIPLDELTSMRLSKDESEEKVIAFYQEAASVVNFLIEDLGGLQKFRMFCRKLEQDGSFREAFASIYTRVKDVEGLNKAWVKFLQQE